MSIPLPQLRVGDAVRHEALSVFPLFSTTSGKVDYRLSDAQRHTHQIAADAPRLIR